MPGKSWCSIGVPLNKQTRLEHICIPLQILTGYSKESPTGTIFPAHADILLVVLAEEGVKSPPALGAAWQAPESLMRALSPQAGLSPPFQQVCYLVAMLLARISAPTVSAFCLKTPSNRKDMGLHCYMGCCYPEPCSMLVTLASGCKKPFQE